jgi:hypothetical protein
MTGRMPPVALRVAAGCVTADLAAFVGCGYLNFADWLSRAVKAVRL